MSNISDDELKEINVNFKIFTLNCTFAIRKSEYKICINVNIKQMLTNLSNYNLKYFYLCVKITIHT